ncbi:MAG: SpvB/TcaC N-terminal domain-containing protein, partial [Nitrospirota bacterium]
MVQMLLKPHVRWVLILPVFSLAFLIAPRNPAHAGEDSPLQEDAAASPAGQMGSPGNAGTVLPDLFTGTVGASIPIDVPPGRNGLQPSLALSYRSNGGAGWVGLGWELGVGAIERSTKNGVNYEGDDYVLRLSGSTVDLTRTSGAAPGDGEFQAKIEGAFQRIQKAGSSWMVTDKTGKRYFFGQTDASRQENFIVGIFKWALDRVEDLDQNDMTFTYFKDAGQIYLDQINYTGHPAQGPAHQVKFHREFRNNMPEMYGTNFLVRTSYRLKTIEVLANGSVARAYELIYVESVGHPAD